MTSSSISENFNFLEPTILKYKQDNEVVCLNSDDKVVCFEDPHLTQDFKALAKLQTKQERLQEFVEETLADFDENLLTNASFKSINNDGSFINEHFNTISSDSGNETSESACKSQKYKYPQLNDTIAKRTRNKLKQSIQSTTYNLLPHHVSDSFIINTSPIIKSKRIKRMNNRKNVQTNKTVLNIPQSKENYLNLQIDTSTNSELNETISDNKETSESLGFSTNSNLNKIIPKIDRETHENSNFSTCLSSSLNKIVPNYRQLEEFTDFSKAIPQEDVEFSTDTNSSLNKTCQSYEQFEISQGLNKNILENEKVTQFNTKIKLPFEDSKSTEICATNSLKKEVTVIDIMYQLDEFERMVHEFKTVVISELNTGDTNSKSPPNKEMDALLSPKNDKNVRHEEELLISEMKNEFKQQFSKNDDYIHNEEVTAKMPKWKNVLNRYTSQV